MDIFENPTTATEEWDYYETTNDDTNIPIDRGLLKIDINKYPILRGIWNKTTDE